MFRNLLVPVDFTARNRETVKVAAELAARAKGRVTLLHVVQVIPLVDSTAMRGFYDELLEASEPKLAELGELLEEHGVEWEGRSVVGSRAAEIVGTVKRDDIDLVVVSSHPVKLDHDEPSEGWATLSYQVAVMAPCPVLLVK